MINTSRTCHGTRCEIRSSLILTVQHLYLVSKITLCSACGKKQTNNLKASSKSHFKCKYRFMFAPLSIF